MSYGYERQPNVMLNNSAVLNAYLYGSDQQTLVPTDDITSVAFTVLKPGDDPQTPTINGAAGTVVAAGHGRYVVLDSVTTVAGEYKGIATFTYDEGAMIGLKRSVTVDFSVTDPFVRAAASPADGAVDQCWTFIEDCFDSEQGGPWLRDMTLAVFDRSKVKSFLPQVLLAINQQMPYSDYNEAGFPYAVNDGEALMALGLLVQTERHLMRAYTEQPDIVSSPVAFMDRKRYQQSWKLMYDVDSAEFTRWLKMWKLRGFDITHASLLLGSKAGRMLPAPMRSRNVGRGF